MTRFTVSVGELRDTAEQVARVGEEISGSSSRGWAIAEASVGHAGLAAALADFHEQSLRATDRLIEAHAEAATRLAASAAAYAEADAAAEQVLTGREADLR
ncbi:hypothetical protein [Actinokineospora sp. HUAS TT18]|uniref:hypothetical protein n=1 Tax=Actinokineospora sp. HUAS TT18 TaxID=3447451 RepID=UPI003F5259A2